MIKKISELTEQDKEKFLKNVKKSMALEQGIPWERMYRKQLQKCKEIRFAQ